MDEKKVEMPSEERELTREELTEEWKKIYKFFANPKCTAKDCYGNGYIGVNIITGRVIGCEKKKCSVYRLHRYELIQRHKKRLEKEKEKELKESGETDE